MSNYGVGIIGLFVLFFASGQPESLEAMVKPVGEYSTIRQNAEHCSGYSVDIWDSAGTIYGVFHACTGMTGDIPGGFLENTEFDSKTGSLVFRAHLTLGSDYLGGGKQVPSKDVFSFKGQIRAASLVGTLMHTDEVYEKRETTTESLALKMRHRSLSTYGSVAEWQKVIAASPGLRKEHLQR